MMYQCRFTNCNKCTTLVLDVDRGSCVLAQEAYGNTASLLDFAVNLNML